MEKSHNRYYIKKEKSTKGLKFTLIDSEQQSNKVIRESVFSDIDPGFAPYMQIGVEYTIDSLFKFDGGMI